MIAKSKSTSNFESEKSVNSFGGQKVCPLFGIFPPNFGPIVPRNPVETAPNLGPTEEFSKKPTYDWSSAMNDEVSGEKVQLLLKTAVPRHFC